MIPFKFSHGLSIPDSNPAVQNVLQEFRRLGQKRLEFNSMDIKLKADLVKYGVEYKKRRANSSSLKKIL